MASFNFYLACCVLLLNLTWHTSTGVPVPTLSADNHAQCSLLFRNLLLDVTKLLNSSVLCFGIPSDKVAMRSKAETVLACAPTQTQNSGCLVQRNSSFNESDCLRNIMKELAHYDATIQSYLKSPLRSPDDEKELLNPTLGIIQSLRKNCSLKSNEESDSSEEEVAQMWGNDSYSNRQEMCKMMRGFHIRTITINRAMGYISSGEHRQ